MPTYQSYQDKIDAKEDFLESCGIDPVKLINTELNPNFYPTIAAHISEMEMIGYKPMPATLQNLYYMRDYEGSNGYHTETVTFS